MAVSYGTARPFEDSLELSALADCCAFGKPRQTLQQAFSNCSDPRGMGSRLRRPLHNLPRGPMHCMGGITFIAELHPGFRLSPE